MDIHYGGIYQHPNDYVGQIILKRSFGGQKLTIGPLWIFFTKSAFIKRTPPIAFFLDQYLECLGRY